MSKLTEQITRRWRKDSEIERIGEFEVYSGAMILSDPCRGLDFPGLEQVNAVENGTWTFYSYREGDYIHKILATLKAVEEEDSDLSGSGIWNLRTYSGQMGIFDAAMYCRDCRFPNDPVSDYYKACRENGQLFYESCCECTASERHAGVLPFGGVSISGGNDAGCYCGIVYRCDGKVIAVVIDFDISTMMTWK